MPQLILGVHSGSHDAAAALFEDYELKAAISLERLTRHKGDGRQHPDLAIDEVLAIAGATRRDVDVVCSAACYFRPIFPQHTGTRWLHWQYRNHVQGNARRHMMPEFFAIVRGSTRFSMSPPSSATVAFAPTRASLLYNHHEAHALAAAVLLADWDDALMVTADAGGDTVNYSHRLFAARRADDDLWRRGMPVLPQPVDSVGEAYMATTPALGFIRRCAMKAS